MHTLANFRNVYYLRLDEQMEFFVWTPQRSKTMQ
jgi:hypothetical protein